jgi:serine/threonine-protein kinase
VPRLKVVRETIPDALEDAINRALAKVPADRYQTAAQFAEALVAASTGTVSRVTAGRRAQALGKPPWRRPVPAAVGVTLLLAIAWIVFGRSGTAGSPASGSGLDPRRVAVLYMEDRTPDKRLGPFAAGLTEGLIERLDEVRALDVISKNGVRAFRGADVDVDSVAAVLKAGTIVRGSVDLAADRIRVEVRLVDGTSGTEIERESFSKPAGEFLALNDSLAEQVAAFLRRRVGQEVQLRERRESTRSSDAWLLVQRADKIRTDAEAALQTTPPESLGASFQLADSLLGQAESLDPRWVQPTVLRGAIALRRARLEADPQRAAPWIDAGLVHAKRALALSPRSPDALELRGTLQYARIQRGLVPDQTESARIVDAAEEDLRSATSLAPDRATAWNALSVLLYSQLDKPGSYLAAQRAYEADAYLTAAPAIVWRLFATSYDMEEFPQAVRWCGEGRRRFSKDPQFVRCGLLLYTMAPQRPDPAAAWSLVDTLAVLTPQREWEYRRREAQLFVAAALARAGLRDSARHVIERARATREIDPRGELMGFEAFARTFLGERDEVIDLIQRYLTDHPEHRAGWGKVNNWWWRELQNHPRYRELSNVPR